jgi:predicted lactoylglutathione lyase
MLNLKVADVRAFVPAKDFAISKAFYTALGWKLTEITEKLTLIELAEWRFYLQDYYVKEWAEGA